MTVAGTGLAAPAYGLSLLRQASDDFDFKVETGEPVDADSSPIGERWGAENSVLDLQDGLELVFRIGMKEVISTMSSKVAPAAFSVASRLSKAS